MNRMVSITASIDQETSSMVAQAAEQRGITAAEYAAESIRRVAESDADYRAFLQAGIDALGRGDAVPHDEVMAELDAMIAKHRARCDG
ncbi:hypothetical protein [Sphingomonas rubra]|uniref:Antitoxin n=1 Tax=Sphingomonas rubra TaxID=634430 RepID=A0A1I5U6D5_9SPHN|nr:hypothetical protein [Sphingomonas rubra]SFP90852.1 hypothetical protein SAMN04488241_110161 [Sphingomonas rubra]